MFVVVFNVLRGIHLCFFDFVAVVSVMCIREPRRCVARLKSLPSGYAYFRAAYWFFYPSMVDDKLPTQRSLFK